MRRLTLVLPLVLLVLVPTGVQAAADDLVVCDAPPEGYTEVGPGASLTPDVASPQIDVAATYTDLNYQLDLYPAKAANKASVAATMEWQILANDWDLFLLDGNGDEAASSEALQPIDPPTESLGGVNILHCGLFTVRVLNFNAVGGPGVDAVDPLAVTVTTGNMK